MILSVFEPLAYDNDTLISANVANFMEFESYEYHKYWRDIGNFTLKLPASAAGIGYVRPDMILFVNEGDDGTVNDSLIINEVSNDGLRVTVSGTDLKGLLSFRQTLFPQSEIEAGTYGHDVRQGSTGSIIAGYITYNCIEATDPNRNIPGLRIGYSGGIQNDTYMSRLQPLNEVVTALCKNADIGWDISFSPNNITGGYEFNIVEGTDRTNTTGLYKCVFADYLHNAEAITKQEKTSERRNVIWTVNGSDVDKAVVTAIYKQDQNIARGFNRREAVLTANCDLDLTEAYVETRTADMIDKTQVGFKLVDPTMYGRKFWLGDKVTVMKNGSPYDRRIIQVDKSYKAGQRDVSVQLGDIPVKKFFEKQSGDLNSRADDVKELALENAATKKTVSETCVHTFFSGEDPVNDPANSVEVNDIWFKVVRAIGSNPFDPVIVEVYKRVILPDASPAEDDDEGEEDEA